MQDFVRFEPLGLACIAGSTPGDWNVKIVDESREDIDNFQEFSIVGVSTTTRTALRAYQIAQLAKKSGCYTVAGGIHASMRVEEALGYFDTVICGEGELPWQDFLSDYERARPRRRYEMRRMVPMDDLSFPRRSALGALYKVGSIQTSRGCPFNCHFCSVSVFSGKRYRFRSPELVLDELSRIPQEYVLFVDDNLIGCSRRSIERAKKIFRGMNDRGFSKKYLAQVTINFGFDEELIALAAESGCRAVFIGIESLDDAVLRTMNKTINLKAGTPNYRRMFERIQSSGIAVIGTIALGSAGEKSTVFQDTERFVRESGLSAVQLTIMTPLPGTRLFEELSRERRIVFGNYPEDWIHYNLASLVFQPQGMSAASFASGWRNLIDNIYSNGQILRRGLATLATTRRLSSAYLTYKLAHGYREAYRNTTFYKHPPLAAFESRPQGTEKEERYANVAK